MHTPEIFTLATSQLRILCLGAHSDDIEIGCGGTILKLLLHHPGSHVVWVVLSARGPRKQEAISSAKVFLAHAGSTKIETKLFKESFFPYSGEAIKEYFEKLKQISEPDLIFTHYRHDLHQDHRVVCELTWNTFRNHQIFEYEIPKYDGDLGQPNVFVPLTQALCEKKVKRLMEGFSTQRNRQWFTEDTFYALLRLRGIESNASEKYAEAFYGRKIVIG
jgi:LmbE family N-acetylglucosaminyl deacetylase